MNSKPLVFSKLVLLYCASLALVQCEQDDFESSDFQPHLSQSHHQSFHSNNFYNNIRNAESFKLINDDFDFVRTSEFPNNSNNNPPKNSADRKRKRPRRICEEKYLQYMNSIFADSPQIDMPSVEDFHGRELADPGEYPHMTAVGFRTEGGKTDYKCGGSLISESFVLTAAHCTNSNGVQPFKVKIGDINLKVREANLIPQKRRIKSIFSHPDYNEVTKFNDIGLLELERPFEFTKFVYPIRLWVLQEIPYDTAFAMGYGATEFVQEQTYALTDMNLTIIANDECNKKLPATNDQKRTVISSQICAYDYEMNRDTCQGDSGGPLQLNLWSNSMRNHKNYFLIGITSYGVFCRSNYPGIYTRVSSYIDWIENIVWKEEQERNNYQQF